MMLNACILLKVVPFGLEGFKQAVPIQQTPVVHRHPGLGQGQQIIVEPDKFVVRFNGNHGTRFSPEVVGGPGGPPRQSNFG